MLQVAFDLTEPPAPESTLDDLGLDSLDAMEVQLMLEDRWGEARLKDQLSLDGATLASISAEIEKRIA